jgi:RHS repeat-associated protein
MKKIDDIQVTVTNTTNITYHAVTSQRIRIMSYFLKSKKDIVKIIRAKAKLTCTNTGNAIINYSNWEANDNLHSDTIGQVFLIDIKDEIQDMLNRNLSYIDLETEKIEEEKATMLHPERGAINVLTFDENIEVSIEYVSKTEYKKNSKDYIINLNRAGEINVDLGTGTYHIKHQTVLDKSNLLPFEINHIYNPAICENGKINTSILSSSSESHYSIDTIKLGNGFALNLNQALIKTIDGHYVYIDENLGEHTFRERYYYKQNGNKIYCSKSDVVPNVIGKYIDSKTNKEVNVENSTETGYKLISDMSTYSNKKLYSLPEEYSNLLNAQKQYTSNLDTLNKTLDIQKKQLAVLGLSKFYSDKNHKVEDLPKTNTELEQDVKKALHPYLSNQTNFNSQNYSIEDTTFTIFIHSNIDYTTLRAEFGYNAYELSSLHVQIQNTINTIRDYTNQKNELQDKLNEINLQVAEFQKQIPIYYLVSNEKILGFAPYSNSNTNKIYRLVMVSDNYDNNIIINYQSLDDPKIQSVTTADSKTITFNYDEDDYLSSIVDMQEREIYFEYNKTLQQLNKITYPNDTFTKYFYTNDENPEMQYLLDRSGMGVKISKQTDKLIIKSLSNVANLTNSQVTYTYPLDTITSSDLEQCLLNNQITFEFYNCQSTIVEKQIGQTTKTTTYLFDSDGNVVTEYDNPLPNNMANFMPIVKSYEFKNGNKSLTYDTNISSTNYLSNTPFEATSVTEFENYLSNNLFDDDVFPVSYNVYHENMALLQEQSNSTNQKIINVSQADISLINSSGEKYFVLTGWAQADSEYVLPEPIVGDERNNRKFGYYVTVSGTNEQNETVTPKTFSNNFDWMNARWQLCSVGIDLSDFATITNIQIVFDYSYNNGAATIVKPQLQVGEYTKTIYENDLPVQINDTTKWQINYIYNDKDLCILKTLTNTENQHSYKTKYYYNKQNKLVKTIDYKNIVEENIYDKNGSLIETKKYNLSDTSSKLCTIASLDEKGQEKEILNEFGEKITEQVYDQNGLLSETKNDETIVSNGYDLQDDLQTSLSASINGISNTNNYVYVNDLLAKVTHNDTDITYNYDNQLRLSSIKIADNTYLSKQYIDDYKTKTTLKSTEEFITEVNDNGNLVSVKYNNSTIKSNVYDNSDNKLVSSMDNVSHEQVQYFYDVHDKLSRQTITDTINNTTKLDIQNQYTEDNLTQVSLEFGNVNQQYDYTYSPEPDSMITSLELTQNNVDVFAQSLAYDPLQRIKHIGLNFGNTQLTKQYSYLQKGDKTSNLISAEHFGKNGSTINTLHYSYYKNGNIKSIKNDGELLVQYEYDGLSRITRENNKHLSFTKTYQYDAGGNIVESRQYDFTLCKLDDLSPNQITKYFYKTSGWKDQLVGYDITTIDSTTHQQTTLSYNMGSYDLLGNPSTHKNNSLVWTKGRQLIEYGSNTFAYNADGIRTGKNGITYTLNGNKIISQTDNTNTLVFQYGTDGVIGFTHNGTQYFYQKNILGDIIAIIDTNSDTIAKYSYDAWGKCNIYVDSNLELPYTIAVLNPFRYRGYYYDNETGLYYLNSRYYDPEIGRFINADDVGILDDTKEFVNGLNLYVYCLNNPVNERDDSGKFIFSSLLGIIIGAAIAGSIINIGSVLISDLINYAKTNNWELSSWQQYVGAAFGGAIGGIISIWNPALGIAMSNMLDILTSELLEISIGDNKNNINWFNIFTSTILSVGIGLLLGKLTQVVPITGLTKGSHSIQQVSKTIITKALNKTISTMSLKSFGKILIYNVISGFNFGWLIGSILKGIFANN